jgi:hypothetical protein
MQVFDDEDRVGGRHRPKELADDMQQAGAPGLRVELHRAVFAACQAEKIMH